MIIRFILLAVIGCRADLFTSIADMESMMDSDAYLPHVMTQFVKEEENRLERLKGLTEEFKRKKEKSTITKDTDVTNPINAFLIIRDKLRQWRAIQATMNENDAQKLVQRINNGNYGVMYPSEEDYKGAAIALLRLQDTYRLDTHELAEGRIYKDQGNRTFDSGDCFEIGRAAYNDEDYYHTVMWMQEALVQLEKEDKSVANKEDVLEYLSFALFKQGNLKYALKYTEELYNLNPNHKTAKGNVKWYEDLLADEGVKKSEMRRNLGRVENRRPSSVLGNKERTIYEALCRNEVPVSQKDISKLYCYYKRDRPFLVYAPIKVEIKRFSPLAVLFKDVIKDDEIAVIQELAKPRLARATVHDSATGKLVHASYRISKSAWLKGWEHEVVDRVNRRIDLMTNLDMETAEELQIANYGIGGHYDPHFDHSRKEETKSFEGLGTGNRIATVLFYMSQPKYGGGTVFTDAKSAVLPTKNDALFWYNLYKQGDGNPDTRHAACPVLVGVKWVSNKWIHTKNQEFRRPCGLTISSEERFVGDLGVGPEPRNAPNLSPVLSKDIWQAV